MDLNDSTFTAVDDLNEEMGSTVMPVTIFIGIEMVAGVIGNIFILIVYGLHYQKSNFRIFVLFMAIVDLTSCLTTLPGEMYIQQNYYNSKHDWICKSKSYFNVYTGLGSALVLLLLAVDRSRKIRQPWRTQINHLLAIKLCAGCLVAASIIAIPITLLWGQQTITVPYKSKTVSVRICRKDDKYKDTVHPTAYLYVFYLLLVALVVFLVILNSITAWTLFRHRSKFLVNKPDVATTPSGQSTGSVDIKSPNTNFASVTTEKTEVSSLNDSKDSVSIATNTAGSNSTLTNDNVDFDTNRYMPKAKQSPAKPLTQIP